MLAHVAIEVDLSAQPIEGSLRADDGIVREFTGYMQLVTVLEAALSARRAAQPSDALVMVEPGDAQA
jgi:hypothetical protein